MEKLWEVTEGGKDSYLELWKLKEWSRTVMDILDRAQIKNKKKESKDPGNMSVREKRTLRERSGCYTCSSRKLRFRRPETLVG